MITTPEIICDVFSFLDKDQIEKIQLVNQFWNNVIIRHKNILPLRLFDELNFKRNQIQFCATFEDYLTKSMRQKRKNLDSYIIKFGGKLSKTVVSSRYSQLTVDEVLTNLNNAVYKTIQIDGHSYGTGRHLLNMMKLITTKTGGRFRGKFLKFGKKFRVGRFDSKLAEIFDNYIIVDELFFIDDDDSYIREVCANPGIVKLPSTPKEIRLETLNFKVDEEVLNFTCNGQLNGANRLTIYFRTSATNYGNFIRQWFELYHTHQSPISLVGKFKTYHDREIVLHAVKTFLNNTQLHVKYSLKTKEVHYSFSRITYLKRYCVLHEMDSYALVIKMEYSEVTDMSSINASDLDRPTYMNLLTISLCVKLL